MGRRAGWRGAIGQVEAGKSVLSQEAHGSNSVERNRHPHSVQSRKLQRKVNVFDPDGGSLRGYSFYPANAEGIRIYPNLSPQEVFFFSMGNDSQHVVTGGAEVLLPEKNEVIIHSADLAFTFLLR